MKRSNLEVGLRVILKKDTLGLGISELIGQEFTISRVGREEYDGDFTVAIDGLHFAWCSHRDLKRVKEEAPKPRSLAGSQEPLGKQELPWSWPKGTPVVMTDEGRAHVEMYLVSDGLPLDTPLFLDSDGILLPSLETADGQYICYVDCTYVKRK